MVGPSPRGRGNPISAALTRDTEGSIPAWAGKPRSRWARTAAARVHPRVGGETPASSTEFTSLKGPSPRGRGNPVGGHDGDGDSGSIPAWAGKPSGAVSSPSARWVHPRVGGETGNPGDTLDAMKGPSPRGRGNPLRRLLETRGMRSIPAWAGKPLQCLKIGQEGRVHPRVGGETVGSDPDSGSGNGPSPRGRGNRQCRVAHDRLLRSIPAWAGKPAVVTSTSRTVGVHPRVGGETNNTSITQVVQQGPSPRGRGNHPEGPFIRPTTRSIPAWAGKPPKHSCGRIGNRVHPRVGGETLGERLVPQLTPGPSPRGRGNPYSLEE